MAAAPTFGTPHNYIPKDSYIIEAPNSPNSPPSNLPDAQSPERSPSNPTTSDTFGSVIINLPAQVPSNKPPSSCLKERIKWLRTERGKNAMCGFAAAATVAIFVSILIVISRQSN